MPCAAAPVIPGRSRRKRLYSCSSASSSACCSEAAAAAIASGLLLSRASTFGANVADSTSVPDLRQRPGSTSSAINFNSRLLAITYSPILSRHFREQRVACRDDGRVGDEERGNRAGHGTAIAQVSRAAGRREIAGEGSCRRASRQARGSPARQREPCGEAGKLGVRGGRSLQTTIMVPRSGPRLTSAT